MQSFLQNLSYALRQLRKSPGFTFTVILTLALGIGANAAVFTLFDQVLLRMLPVQQPKQLVRFEWTGSFSGSGSSFGGGLPNYFSYPMYKDLRDKNQVFSGMLAAEKVAAALAAGRAHDELIDYEAAWRRSPIGHDLWRVRNAKPLWSKLGTLVGVALGGIDMWTNTLGFSLFGTLKHGKPDFATLKPAAQCKRIVYQKPDGKLTFDRLSSVYLSNTNHEEDQPAHLLLGDAALQKSSEHDVYAGPSARYCPAGVYEWVEDTGGPRYVINAQNCVHCKTCDIKDPNQNITWVPPEGGGGPNYPNM